MLEHWANLSRLSRLGVDKLRNDIAFIDTATGETVVIVQNAHDPFPERIVVNGQPLEFSNCYSLKGNGDTWRRVYHCVTGEHCEALRVGLTVHCSWFSSTPHTFELSPEPGFEEVFFFRSSTLGAKGVLEGDGLWPDGTPVDAAWPVRDGQFAQVPMGTHRVAVLPVEGQERAEWWYWWCYLALHQRWEKNR